VPGPDVLQEALVLGGAGFVDVGVDEPGHYEAPARFYPPFNPPRIRPPHVLDPFSFDYDHAVVEDSMLPAVESYDESASDS
jgi:hypothetical protein